MKLVLRPKMLTLVALFSAAAAQAAPQNICLDKAAVLAEQNQANYKALKNRGDTYKAQVDAYIPSCKYGSGNARSDCAALQNALAKLEGIMPGLSAAKSEMIASDQYLQALESLEFSGAQRGANLIALLNQSGDPRTVELKNPTVRANILRTTRLASVNGQLCRASVVPTPVALATKVFGLAGIQH